MIPRGRLRPRPSNASAIGTAVTPRVPEPGGPAVERYEELEGHRGIAIVGIVVFHTFQFCSVSGALYAGTLGFTVLGSLDAAIPWFLVLTAFLLFQPVARSIVDGGPVFAAGGYLKRRAVRILPAYYLAVIVAWFPRQQSLPGDWRDLLEHLTFTQVFDDKRIFYTIGPASSLSVEVYCYLALGLVGVGATVLCRRLDARRWRIAVLVAVLGGVAAISLVWKAWSLAVQHRPTTGSPTTWLGPVANLDVFAVGMLLAVIAVALGPVDLGARGRAALRLAAAAVLVVAFATRRPDSWPAAYFYSECAVAFGFLIAAAALGRTRDLPSRVLGSRPLVWLGGISFGIFLWHEPVMLGLRTWDGLVRQSAGAFVRDTVVVLVASVVAGWLSWVLIERPASGLGGLFDREGRLRPAPDHPHRDPPGWETFRSGNPF